MTNYVEELKLLENVRVNKIVKAAREEFRVNGIINSKLKDIAKKAKVGEATLYRHFADKTALAKLVAFDFWYEESAFLNAFIVSNFSDDKNGLEKVLLFLSIFKESYKNHKDFLKFMEDFDNYMMNAVEEVQPSSFETLVLSIKSQFISYVEEGKNDGSIRNDIPNEEMYAFVSQVVISTIQQLAIRTGYLQSDNGLDADKLLDNLFEMFICFVKNN